MKKSIIFSLGLLVASAVFTGCTSELDIEKHGNLGSQETFYQTDEEVEQAVASMYVTARGNYYTWSYTVNPLSDDVWSGGGSRGDNAAMEKLNEYNFDSDNGQVEGVYSGMYSNIYKANLIIDRVEDNTAFKKQAIAEAKVIRAYSGFQLVTLFGTAPVVDHLLESTEYQKSNSTPAEWWAFIEKDLTEAINSGALVSKANATDSQVGGMRVTKEFAEAMLGKAYLFQGKYSEAATELDKVINSKKYELMEDYNAQFHALQNNNKESIFAFQTRNDPEQAWNVFTFQYIMQGWRTDHLSYGGKAVMEMGMGTYGFLNPRKDLYDAFVKVEGKDGYRLNATMLTYDKVKEYGVSLLPGSFLYGSEGIFMWKNQTFASDCIINAPYFQALQYTDLKVMRYAEVLLMAAEAQLQAGNSAKAVEYFNQIRKRAQAPTVSSITLADIKTEKRLELCNEGVRFQDLVRWGDAEAAMKNQGAQIPSYTEKGVAWNYKNDTYGFKAKNNLLPIPQKEIELNKNMTQNTGW